MSETKISKQELEEIQTLYGSSLEKLSKDSFDKIHKELRQKYHPDVFEKYDDMVVREMAKEKFQRIEILGAKVKAYFELGGKEKLGSQTDIYGDDARFAFDNMKIELITRDKDLKYRLFGTYLRWLEQGDSYKIPGTKASIIVDQNHSGRSIGFVESIKMYLSFGEEDPLEDIVLWLYKRITGRANGLIIHGKRIPVNLDDMLAHMKTTSFLRIGPPSD